MIPATFSHAAWRGIRCTCPRCGQGQLFYKWLKPQDLCTGCGLNLTPQRADDFPAYIVMIITGHLMAPVIIALSRDVGLGVGAMMAIIVPLALVMMLAMLQPAKGAVIATQWWFGMHGFLKERLSEEIPEAAMGTLPEGQVAVHGSSISKIGEARIGDIKVDTIQVENEDANESER